MNYLFVYSSTHLLYMMHIAKRPHMLDIKKTIAWLFEPSLLGWAPPATGTELLCPL